MAFCFRVSILGGDGSVFLTISCGRNDFKVQKNTHNLAYGL